MIETKYKTLDAHNYSVTQLPAMRGLKMLARLTRTLGPALAKLADVEVGGSVDVSSLGEAVAILGEKLTDAEVEGITNELLTSSTVDDQPLMTQFNAHFAGKPELALQVLAFAIEVNFGGFFAAARSALASARKPEKAKAPDTGASTSPRS